MTGNHNNDTLYIQLLTSAAQGTASAPFKASVARVTPLINDLVARTCRSKSSRYSSPDDINDIQQEVIIRLLRSPPQNRPQKSAEATVRTWLAVTTTRLLTDRWRKDTCNATDTKERRVRKVEVNDVDALGDNPGSHATEDIARFEANDELNAVLEYLKNRYPKGAKLVKTHKNHPDCTPAEISIVMGITVDNYYQILTRTKKILSDFHRYKRPEGRRQ
ncbi:MAG: RNA polymerase sigma factor [Deltaproteobacteria bacterium]|nr:RNA polymerase sigma factor [Deltaproteobacteria bacterium]